MKTMGHAGSPNSQFKTRLDTLVAFFILGVMAITAFIGVAAANPTRPGDMTSGSLLLKAKDGTFIEAPRLGSDYTVTISGPTGRTILTQRFQNPAKGWVEGIYVFPLPETAAVDTLKIVSGTRIIVGEVKEKQEAKLIYEKAKAEGQTASLLEQERPNIFTNSVANIGPNETVVVQIEYQETIRVSNGVSTLRLPLVVAPRYNPAPVIQTVDFTASGDGYGITVSDPVKDRKRIEPPVLDPRKNPLINPVSITVKLNAGFELGDVKSAYHNVNIEGDAKSRVIRLASGEAPANKDFELTWAPKGAAPQVGLFKEVINGKDYLLATITPPTEVTEQKVQPRETIFVIDNSGSMEGPSMVQAKEALLLGLGKLTAADRFNVIRFDDTFDVLFPTAVPADQAHIAQAMSFVSALNANGGTEMIPPLKAALIDDMASAKTHLRQVVFITDGAIGNEQEMFATLVNGKGRSRVFMVGIGSAPNSYLMTRAAELGRGTFTFIGDANQVTARMEELFSKIGQPVLTNLTAELDGAKLSPSSLPDLYRGEPVLVMAEGKSLNGTLTVKGLIGDTPWQISLPASAAAPGKGISKLWAHRKVAEIETSSTLGEITPEQSAKNVLAVALEHQIVSSQTSLIAVDKSPKRPAGEELTSQDIPLSLPEGWNYDKVFGKDLPAKSIDEREATLQLYQQLAVVDKPVTINQDQQQVSLPEGSTPKQLMAMLAVLLAALALMFRWLATRNETAKVAV